MGFSPVREISTEVSQRFVTTGLREATSEHAFAKGGGSVAEGLLDGGVTVFDIVAQQLTSVDFRDIDGIWVQAGVGMSSQEAVPRIGSSAFGADPGKGWPGYWAVMCVECQSCEMLCSS